jgi:hypothetical protein
MERHEWEYGVSPVAALFIAAWIVVGTLALIRRRPSLPWSRVAAVAGAVLLALVPLLLNWYSPSWNAFLKGLPFFGSSSQLVRWFSAYIPVAVVLAGLALDRMPVPREWRPVLATAGIVALLGWNFAADRSYYAAQLYRPATIESAYALAASSGAVPPVHAIGAVLDAAGHLQMPIDRNDLLTGGVSQLACYQPILGYSLESFPVGSLHSGQAMRVANGVFNVKNPACYLFPAENSCAPGDQFPASAREDVVRFLAYQPFPFAKSVRQSAADWVSRLALLGIVAALAAAATLSLRRSRRPRSGRRR